MKLAVVGAGAIGAYVGACVARAGGDVSLFARGPHLEAMQRRGVRVVGSAGEFEAKPRICARLEDVGVADVVVLAVKAHSLPALAPTLGPVLGPQTTVISTQNGLPWWFFERRPGKFEDLHLNAVDPGGIVAKAIELRRVLGSIVYFATEIVEPGVIRHTEGDRLSLGEPDGIRSDRVRQIAQLLGTAGLRCRVVNHIREEIWVKLVGSAAFNPLSVLTGGTLGDLLRDHAMRELVRAIMTESEAIARGLGIELPLSIEHRLAGAEKIGEHKTSMLQDLEAGRPMELEAIVGSLVELAERLEMDIPRLKTVYACTRLMVQIRSQRPLP